MQTKEIKDVNLNSKSWRKCSSVRGNQVKLGVQAPKEVSVHREEIYQRILQSKDEHVDGTS